MARRGQLANPENTFRTHLGDDRGLASDTIGALIGHAWAAWKPGVDFPYQPGSGYGDMNDKIIPAPPGQYETYKSLNQVGTTAQEAQKAGRWGPLLYALKKFWAGENT